MTISIGVQGASGGLGASSLVGALAVRAAQRGREVVCVDHHPASGGLDVVLGVEQRPGLRWPDLHRARGALDGERLLPALPGRRGVRVVSCDRRRPRQTPLAALDALRRGLDASVDLVVHDLPGPEAQCWPVLVPGLDLVVLLTGASVHQVAAATSVRLLLDELSPPPCALVVRAARADEAQAVAEAVGLPLAGTLRDDRGVPACLARGSAPGSDRGPLRDCADELLRLALAETVAA